MKPDLRYDIFPEQDQKRLVTHYAVLVLGLQRKRVTDLLENRGILHRTYHFFRMQQHMKGKSMNFSDEYIPIEDIAFFPGLQQFFHDKISKLNLHVTTNWKTRCHSIITQWNNFHPRNQIFPYYGDIGTGELWRQHYNICSSQDFEFVFGIRFPNGLKKRARAIGPVQTRIERLNNSMKLEELRGNSHVKDFFQNKIGYLRSSNWREEISKVITQWNKTHPDKQIFGFKYTDVEVKKSGEMWRIMYGIDPNNRAQVLELFGIQDKEIKGSDRRRAIE